MSKSSLSVMARLQPDLAALAASPLHLWLATLAPQLEHWQSQGQHGDMSKWLRVLAQLPTIKATDVQLSDTIRLGPVAPAATQAQLTGLLKQFMPWRKGPFDVFGVNIDTEWRSDWKWQRVLPHIQPLTNRQVLDVGCGSGYHLWRMLEAGAEQVWGIDPSDLFLLQFLAIRQLMPAAIAQRAHFFPLGIEAMPNKMPFDTVFSMGVLYHRRPPFDFLQQLYNQLRSGGQLVLETLVVDGDETTVLVPGERYAKMRNVWFLPSCAALAHWLRRTGFKTIEQVDLDYTQVTEQRATEWMTGESLSDFIRSTNDLNQPVATIEGYPPPQRAVFVATK